MRAAADAQRSVQMVSLQVNKVGRLKADRSFVPESGSYEVPVRVELQPNGEWRVRKYTLETPTRHSTCNDDRSQDSHCRSG